MKKPILQKKAFESREAFFFSLYRYLTRDEWTVSLRKEGLDASRITDGKRTEVSVAFLRAQKKVRICRRQDGKEMNASYCNVESAVIGWVIPYDRIVKRLHDLESKESKPKDERARRCAKHFWTVIGKGKNGKTALKCIVCNKQIERARYKLTEDGDLVKKHHRPVLVRTFCFKDDGMQVSYRLVPIRGKNNQYHIKPSFPKDAKVVYKKIKSPSFGLAKGIATNWLKHKLGLDPIGKWAVENKRSEQ